VWDASIINKVHAARILWQDATIRKEEVPFVLDMLTSIKQKVCFSFHALQKRVSRWIKPPKISFVLSTLTDLTRGKAELLVENALVRHQLIILRWQIKRPAYRKRDRFLLVLLGWMVRTWKQAFILVQPETLLRLPSWALPRVLETQIIGSCEQAKALAWDDHLDQREGTKQSESSEPSTSVASTQAGYSHDLRNELREQQCAFDKPIRQL
jgi:hypothetical protein